MINCYAPGETDFSHNGIRVLQPTSCTVHEALNAEFELTLEHPIDERDRWASIELGSIIKAPVPSRIPPSLDGDPGQPAVQRERWKVDTTTGERLYLRAGPGTQYKSIKLMNVGTLLIVLEKRTGWYRVRDPVGAAGWCSAHGLTYIDTITERPGSRPKVPQARAQPFRVYQIEDDLHVRRVHARHIFYDLSCNILESATIADATGTQALTQILTGTAYGHDFSGYTNVSASASATYERVNPVHALLDEENGFVKLWGGELFRDWFDLYLVDALGGDTGVTLAYRKNIYTLSYQRNIEDLVTRVMPIGRDANGDPLLLPEKYIDSPALSDYPFPRIGVLDTDASVGDQTTTAQAYVKMREAASKYLSDGADTCTPSISIDHVALEAVKAYSEIADLERLYLGDWVHVRNARTGLSVKQKMISYEFDALHQRYLSTSYGAPMMDIVLRILRGGIWRGAAAVHT